MILWMSFEQLKLKCVSYFLKRSQSDEVHHYCKDAKQKLGQWTCLINDPSVRCLERIKQESFIEPERFQCIKLIEHQATPFVFCFLHCGVFKRNFDCSCNAFAVTP